jgi:Mn2+/Fe2+ NRAMP family transporter
VSQARQDLIGVCFIAGQFVRVVVTRLVAIVPTVIVALAFDSSENELDNLSEWLNVLQSIQLPFALIPLLCLVSNTRIMGVFVISNITKVRRCRETLDSAIGLVYLL